MRILCPVIQLYLLVLVGRAILSFFPLSPESGLWPVQRFLIAATEPVLAPLRRVIPPLGMFDMSFLVLFIGVQIIEKSVLHCSGGII